MTKRVPPEVVRVVSAGANHEVLTLEGRGSGYRLHPCSTCPWRQDIVGEFPAEAFRASATTAYDMAPDEFACHQSGATRPTTCAGYILHGSAHNLGHRLALWRGSGRCDVRDGGHGLFANYRAMAVANGVEPDDPVLARCRNDV